MATYSIASVVPMTETDKNYDMNTWAARDLKIVTGSWAMVGATTGVVGVTGSASGGLLAFTVPGLTKVLFCDIAMATVAMASGYHAEYSYANGNALIFSKTYAATASIAGSALTAVQRDYSSSDYACTNCCGYFCAIGY